MGDPVAVDLSLRFYNYIKSTSITGIIPAITELLTNSIDAYNRDESDIPRLVNISMDYAARKLIVCDNATGVDSDMMSKCFGEVGTYTSTEGSRGFFSKGAKDVSAIGDVQFTSIKDGKFSQCVLTVNSLFSLSHDGIECTEEHRTTYGIPLDGLHVKVSILSSVSLPTFTNLSVVNKYYSLRDIFSNLNNVVNVNLLDNGVSMLNSRIAYQYPAVKSTLIDETFLIPGYEDRNFSARFTLYELNEKLSTQEYNRYMEYGVLITTSNAIHDLTTFYNDVRSHPKLGYVFGRLECDAIDTLMYDFDEGKIDSRNPFPVIDPSRTAAIDKSHPFVKALYSRPHKILKYILQDMYQKSVPSDESFDISSIFKDVSLFGSGFFQMMENIVNPYSMAASEKLLKYINKTQDNVVASDPDAKYAELESDFEQDPIGEFDQQDPKLSLKLVNDDSDFVCRFYSVSPDFIVEINTNDELISKFVTSEGDVHTITNRSELNNVLVEIISNTLAFEIIKSVEHTNSKDQQVSDINSYMIDLNKYRKIFIPKLYSILVENDLLT